MHTVCAVVVAYNRKDLLHVCLEALLTQTRPLDSILVVDNASTDGTAKMLESEFPSITVIRLESNTGGAGGFYYGIKRAHEDGYDMFWLMDDDAAPSRNALEMLLSEPAAFWEDVVCLAGKVTDSGGGITLNHRGYFNDPDKMILGSIQRPVPEKLYEERFTEIDAVSFVGPLIKRQVIDRIGYPMKEFFIHNDDMEYSIRMRGIGKILLIGASVVKHFELATSNISDGSVKRNFTDYDKLWIRYYGKRNLCYIAKREYRSFCRFLLYLAKGLLTEFRGSIGLALHADHKVKRICLPYLSILNGLRNNFDNTVPRGWLYGKVKV